MIQRMQRRHAGLFHVPDTKAPHTSASVIAAALVAAAFLFPRAAESASDPRFFGAYAGTYNESYTVLVPVFPPFIWTRVERTMRVSITATVDYHENARGNGLISGKVQASANGQTVPAVFSGVISARGTARISGVAPGHESITTTALLSRDGNALTISAMGYEVTLRKDLTGNAMPRATIVSPRVRRGATFRAPWGETIIFRATASDREDTSFPNDRLIWRSDRDGRIGTGLLIGRSNLSPGLHRIIFSATDSGGRTAFSRISVEILNNPPNRPVIERPLATERPYTGQEITFRGRASDREDGNLMGHALVWSSSIDGRLGVGIRMGHALSEGAHTITLTATDACGLTASVRLAGLTIQPLPAGGNLPPSIRITAPEHRCAMSSEGPILFTASASDPEDGPLRGEHIVWKDHTDDAAGRPLGVGGRLELDRLPVGAIDTPRIISATAIDSADLPSIPDTITIYVIPGGLY